MLAWGPAGLPQQCPLTPGTAGRGSWAPSPCPGPTEPQHGVRQGRKGAGGDECFLTLRSETEKCCHSAAPASAVAR